MTAAADDDESAAESADVDTVGVDTVVAKAVAAVDNAD